MKLLEDWLESLSEYEAEYGGKRKPIKVSWKEPNKSKVNHRRWDNYEDFLMWRIGKVKKVAK